MMKIVKVYEQKPMDSRKSFYGKAKVQELDDGSKVLLSYGTPVCRLSPSGRVFRTWGGVQRDDDAPRQQLFRRKRRGGRRQSLVG